MRANGTVEQLPMDGYFMVGVFEDEKYSDRTLQLEHGDMLVMFTDGVTEAMNPECEMFGKERLDEILRREGVGREGVSSLEIVEAVKAGIAEFVEDAEQSDDITMLVVKRL